jgi:hypothetical protein
VRFCSLRRSAMSTLQQLAIRNLLFRLAGEVSFAKRSAERTDAEGIEGAVEKMREIRVEILRDLVSSEKEEAKSEIRRLLGLLGNTNDLDDSRRELQSLLDRIDFI